MPTSDVRLVVFDMAGTTVEDRGQVPAAFNAALAAHGLSVDDDQLRAVRGASKRDAIRSLLADGPDREERANAVYATFRQELAKRFSQGVSPIAGAANTFASLRERGIGVALNTGFDRDTTSLLIETLGWREGVVDTIVCGDDVRQGRPAPYMIFRCMENTGVVKIEQVVNVGDTALDLEAGANACVGLNVAVLSGAHDRERLEPLRPDYLIDSVADLPALLLRE